MATIKLKGTKLVILSLLAIILGTVGIMYIVSGGSLKSWSIADATSFRWMLGIILGSIVGLLYTLALKHEDNGNIVEMPFKWIPKVNLRQLLTYNALAFLGVLIFGMGGNWLMKGMHWVFTPLAAAIIYLVVVQTTEKGLKRIFYQIGLGIGVVAWVIGLVTNLWTVYLGEFIYLITPIIWTLNQLDKVKD